MASNEITTEAPIMATELDTDPAAPASGAGAGAGTGDCPETKSRAEAEKKSATIRATAKDLKETAWGAMTNEICRDEKNVKL